MPRHIGKGFTPRHHLPYAHVPTVRGPVYGYSVDRYATAHDYAAVLDCVYEMADAIATSNAVSIEHAIALALRDEEWYILPRHWRMIANLLSTEHA